MSKKQSDRNRLKLQIDNAMREINRDKLDPQIPPLTIDGVKPVLRLVASARAAYLGELFKMTEHAKGGLHADDVKKLAAHRQVYEEVLKASQALETAIERGYLEVEGAED